MTIAVDPLQTGNAHRDQHLATTDFFDTARFPTATFQSTSVVKSGQGRFTVNGNLVMHGITKSVTLDAEGPAPEQADLTRGTFVAGFVGKTTLARKDFGLTQGGPLLAYDVPVELDIELSRPRN